MCGSSEGDLAHGKRILPEVGARLLEPSFHLSLSCLAEIRGSKETAAQPLPLYDTPYEPEEEGATPEGEGALWPRESRLPEDDERPPEEYDQPWEWKKERISKAFAGESGWRIGLQEPEEVPGWNSRAG
jgi:hypothetical protein